MEIFFCYVQNFFVLLYVFSKVTNKTANLLTILYENRDFCVIYGRNLKHAYGFRYYSKTIKHTTTTKSMSSNKKTSLAAEVPMVLQCPHKKGCFTLQSYNIFLKKPNFFVSLQKNKQNTQTHEKTNYYCFGSPCTYDKL